jgi:hypothetical protein
MIRLLLLRGVVSLVTFHVIYCANITLVVDNLFGTPSEDSGIEEDYESGEDYRSGENTTMELWRYIRNGTGLMNIEGEILELSCTADVPIEWKWTEDGVRRQR